MDVLHVLLTPETFSTVIFYGLLINLKIVQQSKNTLWYSRSSAGCRAHRVLKERSQCFSRNGIFGVQPEWVSKILFVRRIYQVVLLPFKVILATGICKCADSLEYFHSTQTGDAAKHYKGQGYEKTLSYKKVLPNADNVKL